MSLHPQKSLYEKLIIRPIRRASITGDLKQPLKALPEEDEDENVYVYVGFDDQQSYFVSLPELRSRVADLHPGERQNKNDIDQEHIRRDKIFQKDWYEGLKWKMYHPSGSAVEVPPAWIVDTTLLSKEEGYKKLRLSTRGQPAGINDFSKYITQLNCYWGD
jgi:hypothetical protein